MRALCIESSGPTGSVAVITNGETLFSDAFACPRGRGGGLFPVLECALAASGDLDVVIVGTGPGSYNGLRMAAAAAHGIARAKGVQVHGVPSLLGYDAADYFVAGDARGGRWFFARVTAGHFTVSPVLLTPESAISLLTPNVPVFTPSGELAGLETSIVRSPSASVLTTRTGSFGDPGPIYLKPPHITQPAGQHQARP